MSKHLSFSLPVKLFLLSLLLPVLSWGQCINPAELVNNTLEICQGEVVTFCPEVDEYCWKWFPESAFPDVQETLNNQPTTNLLEDNVVIQLMKTNGEGAIVEEIEIEIILNDFTVNLDPLVEICEGETIILSPTVSGTGSFSYLWSTGETTNSITVSPSNSTSYTVSVTDNQVPFCSVSKNIKVQILNFEDISELRMHMEENGFVSLPIDEFTYIPYENIGLVMEEYAQLVINIGGNTIDVNEDVGSFLIDLEQQLATVKGKVKYFDEDNLNCEEVILRSFNRSVTGERSIYQVEVVATQAADNSQMIHVKLSDNLFYKRGDELNTIYLLKMDDVTIDMNTVKIWVESYFDLLYCLPDDINGTCNYQSKLRVEVVGNLDPEDLDDKDALSIIGNDPSEIIALAVGTYCEIHSDNFPEVNVVEFLRGDILERGDAFGRKQLSYINVSAAIEEVISDFKCTSLENTIGFLAFHATGHNAGITHSRRSGQGYMSYGSCIVWELGKSNFCHGNFSSNTDPYSSLEELIVNTPPHILRKIKNRYE